MERTKHVLLLLALGLVVVGGTLLSSCKKKDTEETLFIIKKWEVTAVKTLAGGTDFGALKGAKIDFKKDGTYTHTGTNLIFQGLFPAEGTWELMNDGTTLNVKGKLGLPHTWDIVEHSISKCILRTPGSSEIGLQLTLE